MRSSTLLAPLALVVSLTTAAAAQTPTVRPLGPATAISTEPFATIVNVRELANGSVLVNDIVKRRVLLLDPALKTATVVADSTSSTAAYGPQPGGLIAYRGDSTLFVDAASLSMLVIDSKGKIARTASVPRSQDVRSLVGLGSANVGFDPTGHLVYRASVQPPRPVISDKGVMSPPVFPDSAMIVRVDLATRKVDTLAYFKIPKTTMTVTSLPNGGMSMTSEMNPLPNTDDYAVLSNGTVVIARGQDYRVDVLGANGQITPGAKIPFDWQRLTDDDKIAFIDSVKAAMEKARVSGEAGPGAMGGNMIVSGGAVGGGGGGGGGQVMTFNRTTVEGGARGGAGMPGMMGGQMNLVSPSQLPDYKPAFGTGALRPDADGNVWIRTIPTKPTTGGPVYDVVNSSGQLVERVQVPASRTIVGFGPGGTVYMSVREGSGLLLEKAKK